LPFTRSTISVTIYFVLCASLQAQSLDSLKLLLNSANQPAERLPLLKQLSEGYLNQRDTAAIKYFEELVELSPFSDDPLLAAYSYYKMGVCRYQQQDIKRSTDLYFKGLESTQAAPQFNEIKARLYNAIGWNFNLLEKQLNALKYFNLAERYGKSVDNPQLKGLILNNKGVTYRHLGKLDSALFSFEESLSINRKINNQRQIRFNLNNISTALFDLKRFNEARTYLNEVLTLNLEAKDTVEIINNLINMGIIDFNQGARPEAKIRLSKALALAEKNNSLEQQRRIYASLISLSEQNRNYEDAFRYQRKFYVLTDSLYRKESIDKILEIEARYNSLQKDRDLQEARRNVIEQRLFLSIIIGALLVTIVIIFFLWRLIRVKRANEKILIDLNHEIQAQAEELRQANEEIHVTNEKLEELVKNRTEVIQLQNNRLLQFAFMNSHKIRGPLATLIGLLNLLQDGKSADHSQEILSYMKSTASKMDEIVNEVSRELEKEDQIKQQKSISTEES